MSRRGVRRRVTVILVTVALLSTLSAGAGVDTAAAATAQTYGDAPLDDVLYWADQTKKCGLTQDKLAALMLAPTFSETGAPPTAAPGPMTLSRWDTQSGLYAFGNPSTAYQHAFWHPGVGMWQFDSAGGWDLTASTAINSYTSAEQAAQLMADRYCVNHSLSYVWAPWFGCSSGACQDVYDAIYVGGNLVGVARDTSVGSKGGMVSRTCSLPDEPNFTCSFVDPAKAQGYAAWAIPSFGPTPVTDPFFVFEREGNEERHWLRDVTGYAVNIKATLPVGSNARTSLTWSSSSKLCDLTVGLGTCDPLPPAGISSRAYSVSGTYTPIAGDFDGDGASDVLWYGPGSAKDSVWWGSTSGSFTSGSTSVSGTYTPLVGDFDGNGASDVLWYGPGSAKDSIWWGSTSGSFTFGTMSVSGTYTPLVGDFDGDGFSDVFWYRPGSGADRLWYGRANRVFHSVSTGVTGTYQPFTGDFDGDGRSDVAWYAPGTAADVLWLGRDVSFLTGQKLNVDGTYTPVPADLTGDGSSDVVWYGPGDGSDRLWYAVGGAEFDVGPAIVVTGTYTPVAGDFDGDGAEDVFWYGPGSTRDSVWRG